MNRLYGTVMGLETEGEISLVDIDVSGTRIAALVLDTAASPGAAGIDLPPQRRRAGMVFQDYALFPNMTVRGNLEFALRDRRARDRVDAILDGGPSDGVGPPSAGYPLRRPEATRGPGAAKAFNPMVFRAE